MAKRLTKRKPLIVTEEDGRPVVTQETLDDQGLPLSPDGCGPCQQKLETACAHCGSTWADPKELAQHQEHSACGTKWLKLAKRPQVRTFSQHCHVDPPTPAQQAARTLACVHTDRQGHIILELSRTQNLVRFIALDDARYTLNQMELKLFEQTYTPIVDYPTGRAATLFVEYATQAGADDGVLDALSNLVAVKEEEREMATARNAAPSRTATKEAAAKPVKVKKEPGERKESAASFISGLLMEGKNGVCNHTDEEIFNLASKKFPNVKRNYPAWYRKHLREKKGLKVPNPKDVAVKAAAGKKPAKQQARASA